MIISVLLGFAALAVVSSLIGDDEAEASDPVMERDGPDVAGTELPERDGRVWLIRKEGEK